MGDVLVLKAAHPSVIAISAYNLDLELGVNKS
jgi:hypothetical protein